MTSEFVAQRPHPALRGVVAGAVGYRQDGVPAGVHRGLPSPFLTLVLPLDAPLQIVAHADPRQPPGAFDTVLGGLHTRPALMALPGRQEGLQLALTPLGTRALLGVPAGELASVDVGLDDVLGSPVTAELLDRVRSAPGWPGRFAAVEEVLRREVLRRPVRPAAGPAPEVAEAWRLTLATGGRLRVAEVAARVGWSERHLTARFRIETGLAPKEAARVVRFDRARRALAARVAAGRRPDLAALAAASGYADQSHLTRDWRAFSGLSPLRWLAAEFGFVQDQAPVPRAGSAA
ncbi:helix-turn-helix domain-containing protein [Geodermatophilus sp. CPCC 206100]|uniref:helix-turn-helix domain-containing protein n=1 Tax=Geodermatophilus sp. CPCC 206100 TaxID=3020054 RepID=UPI003AFF7CE9